jgi:hypothetical protein
VSDQVRLSRLLSSYDGIPAAQVAKILRADVADVRAGRRRLGRNPEVGGPLAYPGSSSSSPVRDELAVFDRLMRGNRGVAGL